MTDEQYTGILDALKGVAISLVEIRDLLKERPRAASTPSSRPTSTPSGGFTGWRAFEIPFGKMAGVPLGKLRKESLMWWVENYKAEGYKGAPPRQSDLEFRAALDQARNELYGGPTVPREKPPAPEKPTEAARQAEDMEEDVPF